MARNDDDRPLEFFSRENFETFKTTYFFLGMSVLCLIAFAISAAFDVERDVLAVPLIASIVCMACMAVTFFLPHHRAPEPQAPVSKAPVERRNRAGKVGKVVP